MRKSLNSRRLNNCNLLFAARLEICEIVSIRPLFSLFLYLCVSMSCVRFHPLNLLIVAANHRSNHCLPTITTIGHKQAELHRIIGCNLVQRERECACIVWWLCCDNHFELCAPHDYRWPLSAPFTVYICFWLKRHSHATIMFHMIDLLAQSEHCS